MSVLLATRMRVITKCNWLLLFHGEINSCIYASRVMQCTYVYVNGPLRLLEKCPTYLYSFYAPHILNVFFLNITLFFIYFYFSKLVFCLKHTYIDLQIHSIFKELNEGGI